MKILSKIVNNKIIIYLFTRYGIYALGFVTSLLVAKELGPYYLGIYGFIQLLLSYFGQLHLGIPNSLNVLIVHNKDNKEMCDNLIGNSLFIYVYYAIIIILLYLLYLGFGFAPIEKYQIDNYLPAIGAIAFLAYINGILVCVLRIKNKINHLSVVTSTKTLMSLAVVFIFSGEYLIMALLATLGLSYLLAIMICEVIHVVPSWKNINIRLNIQRVILTKGLFLFVYNTCFYFIMISIQTIISANYDIREFGFFTFSYTMASAVMMLLDSLMYIIFPKLVDLLSSTDTRKVCATLDMLRVTYVSSTHLLVYIALVFLPILFHYLMPQYRDATCSFSLISLSILMNTNSCGYSTLLIARNKEKYSAAISISALLLNVVLAFIMVYVLRVPYSLVILSVMLTYTYFSLAMVMIGRRILRQSSWKNVLATFFPLRLLIPYLVAIYISVAGYETIMFLPLLVFVLLNVKDIKRIINYIRIVINNENISDVHVKL